MSGEALAGLIGVALGGLLTGTITYLLERRREQAHGRAVQRLIILELVTNRARAERIDAAQEWSERFQFETEIWASHRETLAKTITDDAWMMIALAYFAVEAANARRRDGQPLSAKDRKALDDVKTGAAEALEEAASNRADADLGARRIKLFEAEAGSHIDRPK